MVFQVSHGISHHLYTNTYMDIEVSGFEPWGLNFLPVKKSFGTKVFQHALAHLAAITIYPVEFLKRVYLILFEEHKLLPENLFAPIQLVFLWMMTQDLLLSTKLWVTIHALCGYMLVIQFSWTHHHPQLYHAGTVRCKTSF